ncbi:MAG: hypothetical protein U0841_09490 [Chloroflexia bacterium]
MGALEQGRGQRVLDQPLGELRQPPVVPGEFLGGAAHQGGGWVEGAVAPGRTGDRAAAVDLPRIEHEEIARLDPLHRAPEAGLRRATLGHGDHEFFVGVRREAEFDEAGAQQFEAAEGIGLPELGGVLAVGRGLALVGVHRSSIAPPQEHTRPHRPRHLRWKTTGASQRSGGKGAEYVGSNAVQGQGRGGVCGHLHRLGDDISGDPHRRRDDPAVHDGGPALFLAGA